MNSMHKKLAKSQIPADQLVKSSNFKASIGGKEVELFTLVNVSGSVAQVTNYGARLVSLWVPDGNGSLSDVVLGFSSLEGYLNAKGNYYGATIGRYANRITNGGFELNGVKYTLEANNENNHLHGGQGGFHVKVWEAQQLDQQSLRLSYQEKHMEEGYPGNLTVHLDYKLTDDNELQIEYSATTDQTTIINLTHHSYFNLLGEGTGTIEDHLLQIHADQYTPVLESAAPSGKIECTRETPFDFTAMRPIRDGLYDDFEQLRIGRGFDHNYVLDNHGVLAKVAKVKEPTVGRVMEVLTDEPGMQLYTGNFLDGSDIGKSGEPYSQRSAFCLETQHFPDSPNHPNFPSTVLEPGYVYASTTVYKFSAE